MTLFIKKNIVKEHISKQGYRVSESFYNSLDIKIENLIDQSIKRSGLNNRNTVQEKDL